MTDTPETPEVVADEETVVETPEVVAAPPAPVEEPAPAKPKMKIKRVSSPGNVVVLSGEDAEPVPRTNGETRTQTDAGPVQLSGVTGTPRERELIEIGSHKIERVRY